MRWVAVAILGLGLMCSCVGQQARVELLTPALQAAWTNVSADAERAVEAGMLDGQILEDFTVAWVAGDVSAAQTLWVPLEDGITAGIRVRVETGEIGPGVAKSLWERLRLFGEALMVLGAK